MRDELTSRASSGGIKQQEKVMTKMRVKKDLVSAPIKEGESELSYHGMDG